MASVAQVERALAVEFGPTRSKRFHAALAEAESGVGECRELEPGRYRVRFLLGGDSAAYAGLARLLERVRHWRATEVYADEELVSTFQAREMAWCASSQLTSFGACRFRFYWGIPPRCALCPLFDVRQAIRDALGENTPPGLVLEIKLGPNLRALWDGHPPSSLDPSLPVPDFLPEESGETDDEPSC